MDHLGQFIRGEGITKPVEHRCRIKVSTNDNCDNSFAKIIMRHADDRAFADAGQRVNGVLDFLWIDVVAASDYQILAASDDVDIALRVNLAEVSSDEPAAFAKFGCGLFGVAPISGEYIRPAHLDCANVAQDVADPHLHAGKWQADSARNPRAVIRVARVNAGFSHAVSFEDRVAGKRLKLAVRFGEQGCRTGDEQPHSGASFMGEGRGAEQPRVKGRHAHQHRCARH